MGKIVWWIVGGVVVGTAAIASTVVLWAQKKGKPTGQKTAAPKEKEGAEKAAA